MGRQGQHRTSQVRRSGRVAHPHLPAVQRRQPAERHRRVDPGQRGRSERQSAHQHRVPRSGCHQLRQQSKVFTAKTLYS